MQFTDVVLASIRRLPESPATAAFFRTARNLKLVLLIRRNVDDGGILSGIA